MSFVSFPRRCSTRIRISCPPSNPKLQRNNIFKRKDILNIDAYLPPRRRTSIPGRGGWTSRVRKISQREYVYLSCRPSNPQILNCNEMISLRLRISSTCIHTYPPNGELHSPEAEVGRRVSKKGWDAPAPCGKAFLRNVPPGLSGSNKTPIRHNQPVEPEYS